MQDLLCKRPGVISTRVGYAGGDVPRATCRHHGTHAEAIEVVFAPHRIPTDACNRVPQLLARARTREGPAAPKSLGSAR